MNTVILYTCDEWKGTDSMRVVGVYTNKKKLHKQIRHMIKVKDIEINEGAPFNERGLNDVSITELSNQIDYLHLTEIELNSVV